MCAKANRITQIKRKRVAGVPNAVEARRGFAHSIQLNVNQPSRAHTRTN